ncbi:hypothetical protein [Streptomyces angustmyceticus]|uniref:hypothetical protein n=1 Tax=Streptomyces angustmyceticus TaxID=285578 RepID=UPI0038058C5D
MIPSTRSHYAKYETAEGRPSATRPVIAWDNDGHPMVVGSLGLVRAEECGNFVHVDEYEAPIVAAIPGDGWLVDCKDTEGNTWTDRILAWTVHADGTATPLTTDTEGVTGDATKGVGEYRLYHPGTTEQAKTGHKSTSPSVVPGRHAPRLPKWCGRCDGPDTRKHDRLTCECAEASTVSQQPCRYCDTALDPRHGVSDYKVYWTDANNQQACPKAPVSVVVNN